MLQAVSKCLFTARLVFLGLLSFCSRKHDFLLFDFQYYGETVFSKKKIEIILRIHPFRPLKNLKNSKFSKVTQHDLLKPNIFYVESISTLKIRIFAKT